MADPKSLKRAAHIWMGISIIAYAAVYLVTSFVFLAMQNESAFLYGGYILLLSFVSGGFTPLLVAIILYIASATSAKVKIAKMAVDQEKMVVAIARSHPKISMAELGERLGETKLQAEQRLLKLISKDKVRGHFDSVSGDFISAMVETSRIGTAAQGFDCPHCGASIMSTPVKGMSVKCPSCGELIVVT